MIEHLKGMADYHYYFTIYPSDHVSLKVVGAVGENPDPAEIVRLCELFSDFVEQFSWIDIRNPQWVRFRLCQVHLLTPRFAAHMGFRDPVTVTPHRHLCRYPGL
ncbi:hypothetical protein JOF56_000852 [Kibdelosporangium banguiense]|uniref:Uncharacterized protein n=1 Tax=Kibdelosporangium banguiense TaxID=1365924 RepID=A0ABS4T7T2_9PSEU|nr:hypothetical protein [Kibdelosporangium banguiense]MBP2320467.1 hypothetical protein [Kibdelosporangium banguiense]